MRVLRVVVAVACLLLLLLPAPVPVSAGAEAADERSALALARRLGRPVEVTGLTTETTMVRASPGGTLTAEIHREPVRVRSGNLWVPTNAHLSKRDDGTIAPLASPVGLVLNGGGDGPLARLGRDGKTFALTWPGPLPRPLLDGVTATYPEVLPGMDLVVTAGATSFSEVLVVKNAAAARDPALARLRFGVATTGLRVESDEEGIRAVDERGEAVISAAPPRMWDSSGTRVSPVGVKISGQEMALLPDLAMLADPATVFPVYIDPTFGAAKQHWTLLWSLTSTPQWDHADTADGYARVGYETATGGKSRSVFQMNTSPVNGKHILRATFRILEKWAYNCTPRPVELWETLGINSGSTWANQPSGMWVAKVAETSAAKGYEPGGCADGNVEFNATAAVTRAAAQNRPHLTLGLRTVETSFAYWKRFGTNPLLEIEYNTVPAPPTSLRTVPNSACVTGIARPYLSSATPELRADLADDDGAVGQQVTAQFEYGVPGSGSGSQVLTQGPRAVPNAFSVSIPAGVLQDNGTYAWRVRAHDGVDAGPWSGWCEFTVDVTAPSAAPAVTSADYPEDAWAGAVGMPGTFAFGTAGVLDVVSYVYGLNVDPPVTSVQASTLKGGASVTLTPSRDGVNTLRVYSVDRAGNRSPTRTYVFYVNF
ncbi:MAG TPA: DNRLRE domain-containing protein [Candidatus Limnocylindrales bacterium]